MGEEHGRDGKGRVPVEGDIRRDEIRAIDIQLRDKAKGKEVVDPPGGPVLQELLVEPGILPEVLPEVEEDAVLPVDRKSVV